MQTIIVEECLVLKYLILHLDMMNNYKPKLYIEIKYPAEGDFLYKDLRLLKVGLKDKAKQLQIIEEKECLHFNHFHLSLMFLYFHKKIL